jgi:hypothetical protein
MSSVRLALVDGPSVLLLAAAVAAAERGRPWWTSAALGVAGLARETNILGVAVLARWLRRDPRSWGRVAGGAAIALLPLALWLDYLRSIYRSLVTAGTDHIVAPFAGLWTKLAVTADGLRDGGGNLVTWLSVTALVALAVQASCVIAALLRRDEWAWLAWPFVALAIVSHADVWDGQPGAFTRVFLPITVGAMVLLARQPHPSWWLIGASALGAFPGVVLMLTS